MSYQRDFPISFRSPASLSTSPARTVYRSRSTPLRAAFEYAPLLMTMEGVEDADWENNWKAFYKPMEIGERLMVIPDWEEADPKGRAALRLNPGLAFGTGGHATTRLCLTALEKIVAPGMKVLDLGCGSGILSIAALLLGAERAFACDIDDKAVDVAYENAALNGVDRDRYTVRAGDVLSDADRGLHRQHQVRIHRIQQRRQRAHQGESGDALPPVSQHQGEIEVLGLPEPYGKIPLI